MAIPSRISKIPATTNATVNAHRRVTAVQSFTSHALHRHAVEAGLEVAFAAQAAHLVHDLAFLEQEQGGDGSDAKLGREVLVLVNVHFADADAAIVFVGQLVEDGRDHFA